jgi:hypothetical protein
MYLVRFLAHLEALGPEYLSHLSVRHGYSRQQPLASS